MEYFDILNRDGSISGQVAQKGEPLSNGQFYLGVHAFIHNTQGDFLLQKRSETKEFLPGGWDIHMGHVMVGETSKTAIIREIHEELGVKIEKENVTFIKRIIWEKYHHFIDIFVVTKDIDICDLTLQISEVEDARYFSRDEMVKLIRSMDYRPEEYKIIMEKYVSGIQLENIGDVKR